MSTKEITVYFALSDLCGGGFHQMITNVASILDKHIFNSSFHTVSKPENFYFHLKSRYLDEHKKQFDTLILKIKDMVANSIKTYSLNKNNLHTINYLVL